MDPEVIFELVKGRVWRSHIWLQHAGTSTYRRVDDGRIAIDFNGTVAGWDEHTYFIQHVRNFTDKPIELEIRRTLPGHIVFRSVLQAVNHDYQTAKFTARIRPGQRSELRYEVVQHMGRNQKQANLKIVPVK